MKTNGLGWLHLHQIYQKCYLSFRSCVLCFTIPTPTTPQLSEFMHRVLYAFQVRGENIVGVAKGAESGDVLLVGADYGTSLVHSPLEDNGAGVAVMLEVARNFMEQMGSKGAFTQVKTVVFVGFDLNTKEYVSSIRLSD